MVNIIANITKKVLNTVIHVFIHKPCAIQQPALRDT